MRDERGIADKIFIVPYDKAAACQKVSKKVSENR
jgi:hypothetical protein